MNLLEQTGLRLLHRLDPERAHALSLLALIDASAKQYQDCSDRGDSLVKAMDEWRNTAWGWWCEAARKSGVSVPADRCPAAK